MSIEGVDYSYDPPTGGELIKAGKKFVVRYGGLGNSGKWLTTKEVLALRAADIDIVANVEKAATAYKGTAAGIEHAKAGHQYFTMLGMPETRPIYFSVDWNATADDWKAIDDALKGSASIIGANRVGVYGGYKTIEHCVNAGTAKWFWQTYAWSKGELWHPKAHIRQYKNNQTLGSGTVDFDQAMTADYGQWFGVPTVAWHLDKGLVTLSNQIKQRRPKAVIYDIGDTSHQAGTSDHNPDSANSVDAIDVMLRNDVRAIDLEALFQGLRKYKDTRIAYVIYNRRIFSSTTSPWVVRKYTGSNPHTDHVHISVNDKHAENATLWRMGGALEVYKDMIGLDEFSFPTLKQGMNDSRYEGYKMIMRLQRLLNIKDDGDYGPATAAAVKAKVKAGDGKTVGKKEWASIAGLSTRAGK